MTSRYFPASMSCLRKRTSFSPAWPMTSSCACALTLAGITSPGSAGGARSGQLGSPWLFHEVGEGENGEDQAYPVAYPVA